MQRRSSCECGDLTVETEGDPISIVVCHCNDCQKRTGSAFGVGAYFRQEKVTVKGRPTIYMRTGETGRKLLSRFCDHCGSTLFWEYDASPGLFGLALGNFIDQDLPPPSVAVWESSCQDWVKVEGIRRRHELGDSSVIKASL